MKKINFFGALVECCNWVLHPLAYHKELMEYRQDYDKVVLQFQKDKERLETKYHTLKTKNDTLEKQLLSAEEQKQLIYKVKNKQEQEFILKLQAKQKTINNLRGKFGGTKKECNKLKEQNKNLQELLCAAREKLIESNNKIIEQDEKIKILSKKTAREKIDYTLMKRSKKDEN